MYVLNIRMSKEDLDRLKARAETLRLPLSPYARSLLVRKLDEETSGTGCRCRQKTSDPRTDVEDAQDLWN